MTKIVVEVVVGYCFFVIFPATTTIVIDVVVVATERYVVGGSEQ